MRDLWTNIKKNPYKIFKDLGFYLYIHWKLSTAMTIIGALTAFLMMPSNNQTQENNQTINNNITHNHHYHNTGTKRVKTSIEKEPLKIGKDKEGKIVVPPQATELTKILPQNVAPPEKTEEVYLPKRTLKRKRRKPTENRNARRKKEMQHKELMEKLFKQKQQKSKNRCDHPVKYFVCLAEGIFSIPKDVIIGR